LSRSEKRKTAPHCHKIAHNRKESRKKHVERGAFFPENNPEIFAGLGLKVKVDPEGNIVFFFEQKVSHIRITVVNVDGRTDLQVGPRAVEKKSELKIFVWCIAVNAPGFQIEGQISSGGEGWDFRGIGFNPSKNGCRVFHGGIEIETEDTIFGSAVYPDVGGDVPGWDNLKNFISEIRNF
jgi:hypothetical protein